MRLFRRKPEPEQAPPPAPEEPEPAPEPPPPPLSVVVVDDTEDIRALMKLGLERYGIEVRGEASDGATAADVVRETKPDIVLLDLHMPEVGGLEALPVILEAHPRCRVVVYSAISATRMTAAAFDAGAHGYIVKGVSPRRIAEHLRRVHTAGAVRPVHPYPLAGGGD